MLRDEGSGDVQEPKLAHATSIAGPLGAGKSVKRGLGVRLRPSLGGKTARASSADESGCESLRPRVRQLTSARFVYRLQKLVRGIFFGQASARWLTPPRGTSRSKSLGMVAHSPDKAGGAFRVSGCRTKPTRTIQFSWTKFPGRKVGSIPNRRCSGLSWLSSNGRQSLERPGHAVQMRTLQSIALRTRAKESSPQRRSGDRERQMP